MTPAVKRNRSKHTPTAYWQALSANWMLAADAKRYLGIREGAMRAYLNSGRIYAREETATDLGLPRRYTDYRIIVRRADVERLKIDMAAIRDRLAAGQCRNGHPLTGENIVPNPRGHARCRECTREHSRRWWQRKARGTAAPQAGELAGVRRR